MKLVLKSAVTTTESCILEGSDVSIDVGHYLGNSLLYLIFPKSPNSDQNCVCPVFISTDTTVRFEQCYCIALNRTVYEIESNGTELVLKNITRYTNDTRFILSVDTIHSDGIRKRDIKLHRRLITQGKYNYELTLNLIVIWL